MNTNKFPKTSVSDGRDNLRKQIGLNCRAMKTALTNSTTFLYLPVKIVSVVESSKERERPYEGNARGKVVRVYVSRYNGHYVTLTKVIKDANGKIIKFMADDNLDSTPQEYDLNEIQVCSGDEERQAFSIGIVK